MSKTLKVLIIVTLSIGGYYIFNELFFKALQSFLNNTLHNNELGYFLTILIIGIPLFIGVLAINKTTLIFESLGLNKSITKGSLFSLICTLPMLIGYSIVFELNSEITWNEILRGAIIAAFVEELYFRGILFGQIYRFTKIGFIPSILYGAIIFASLHLHQSQDLLTLIGIFASTFLGAILFAWAYIEWKNNLWVPIFLHLFMNLFWMLFSAGENALGGVYSNIFRILTIVLIIFLTIIYKKKKGQKLEINKSTIWMKNN
jgi:membrane protease YdiL (CAAX protease family)